MVKRNNYPQEYKNKLSAEICAGTSPAVISKRENIGALTLNKWKANYLSGDDIEHKSKAEITEMRKNFLSFPCIYADAILKIQILKKTEKFLKIQKRKESSSSPISPRSLVLKRAVSR